MATPPLGGMDYNCAHTAHVHTPAQAQPESTQVK